MYLYYILYINWWFYTAGLWKEEEKSYWSSVVNRKHICGHRKYCRQKKNPQIKPQKKALFPQIAKGLCYLACFGNLYIDEPVWRSEGVTLTMWPLTPLCVNYIVKNGIIGKGCTLLISFHASIIPSVYQERLHKKDKFRGSGFLFLCHSDTASYWFIHCAWDQAATSTAWGKKKF